MTGTPATIAAAVAAALPAMGGVRCAVPVGKGHSGEGWRVETAGGPVLARIALRDADGRRLANAAAAVREARVAGVETPPLLYWTAAHGAFAGRPFSIAAYVAGEDGEDALPRMDPAARTDFFADWGEAVRRLHGVGRDAFADDALGRGTRRSWAEVVEARLDALPARYAGADLAYGGVTVEAAARVRAGAREVSGAVRPALVHHDLYLPNTLVAAGRFAGLLDFEYARVWDPVSDFVKPALFVFGDFPGAREAMLGGYRRAGEVPREFEARLAVALGLELVTAIPVFQGWGASDVVALYRRALERFCDGADVG